MAGSLEIKLAIVGAGRAEAPAFEDDVGELLSLLIAGLDDVKGTAGCCFFAFTLGARIVEDRGVNLAVGVERTSVALLPSQFVTPKDFSAVHIDPREIALLRNDANAITHQNRRTCRGRKLIVPEFHLSALDDDRSCRRIRRLNFRNFQ